MTELSERLNGWMALFRIVTPSLLAVLIWVVTNGQSQVNASMLEIRSDLKKLSNDYYHQLGDIKDRLGRIEGRQTAVR